MKIAFISYLHGFGGAEKQNIMLANQMVNKGHDVTLISLCADIACFPINKRIKRIFIQDIGKGTCTQINRYLHLKNQLRQIRPDITVSFWLQSAYFTAFMPRKITGKVIYSERGDPGDKEYAGLLGIIRMAALPFIDGFVFQSNGACNYFNAKIRARSVVISNPVFIKRDDYPTITSRRKTIVNIGRLHPQKNQKLLIEAFGIIADKYPEYNLEIYGNGEMKEKLDHLIRTLGLENRAFLMGAIPNVHKKIYDAALFVLSSDYEGLPNGLIESMALGLPCISTDCRPGGARELISNGENGLIVPTGNVKALAQAMDNLLGNPKYAEKMAHNSLNISEKNRPKEIYDKWESFFLHIGGLD